MRKPILCTLVLSSAGLLTACGQPKADASSEAAFKASITEMEKNMDDAKKEKLETAVQRLMMKNVMFASGGEDQMKQKMKETFDNKTADEIIADGDKAKSATDADMKKLMQ